MSTVADPGRQIKVPEDVLVCLQGAARRELEFASDNLARVKDPDQDASREVIEHLEAGLAAYHDVNYGSTVAVQSARMLAASYVEWKTGNDGVPLPQSLEDADAFIAC